ncbi:hypothetical protein GCM10010521_62190 [Streptomyces rameus]|uniref:GmrSD restriction endonucleases C-terminal domain-containing protein n=1 Tax=Streptomyces rameus TaxID=68261 RepID=A0ABN3V1Y3_9ACTN
MSRPGSPATPCLVPLAEAWDSGASAWTAAEREAYANDLGDDRALIAVSAASNRSKADQDPSTWLPPAAGYRCQYATDWIADKTRWGLSIDTAESRTHRPARHVPQHTDHGHASLLSTASKTQLPQPGHTARSGPHAQGP